MRNLITNLFIDINHYSGQYNFYFRQKDRARNTIALAEPMVMQTRDHVEGISITQIPTFSIDCENKQFLQDLIDEIWNLGIRPTNVRSGNDLVDALGNHLQDMKTIAFHKLGIPK